MWWKTLILSLTFASLPAHAEEDAKSYYDRGTAMYALQRYAEAAQAYEKAFELKPDPALLYNAAQAHRLAGNKPRALALYTSLLRLYGDQLPNRAEIHRHIDTLKKSIENDQKIASSPPVSTVPPTKPVEIPPATKPAPEPPRASPPAPPPPAPKPEAPPPVVSEPVVPPPAAAETPAPPPQEKTEKKKIKPWVWAVVGVGAAVLVGAGIGLGVGLGSRTEDPTATFGTIRGN